MKLFPASVGGPAYLRAVKAPLAEVPLVPTGGVGLEEIGRYPSMLARLPSGLAARW